MSLLLQGALMELLNMNARIFKMDAFLEMHRMQLSFSKDATMGRLIHDILYRELKEYLERWGVT